MLERIGLGRRAAVAVAPLLALALASCGGETSSGGVQAQPGVYPLILIGVFLVVGGAVATWALYRKPSAPKSTKKSGIDQGGRASSREDKLSDDAQAGFRTGADGADDGRSK